MWLEQTMLGSSLQWLRSPISHKYNGWTKNATPIVERLIIMVNNRPTAVDACCGRVHSRGVYSISFYEAFQLIEPKKALHPSQQSMFRKVVSVRPIRNHNHNYTTSTILSNVDMAPKRKRDPVRNRRSTTRLPDRPR